MRTEGVTEFFEKSDFKGVIGFWYSNDFVMILIYLMMGVIALLALIGLLAVLTFFIRRRKRRKAASANAEPYADAH
jgi:hypothetical protein